MGKSCILFRVEISEGMKTMKTSENRDTKNTDRRTGQNKLSRKLALHQLQWIILFPFLETTHNYDLNIALPENVLKFGAGYDKSVGDWFRIELL